MPTNFRPMKLTDVGTDIEPYLSHEWVMQQKHDGARMIAIYENGALRFLNGSGSLMSFSAAKIKLPALQAHLARDITARGIQQLILDGELIIETGVYHVFDVIVARDSMRVYVSGTEPWAWRDMQLRNQLSALEGDLVRFAVTAQTPTEKRELWDLINAAGVEGAVSKRRDSLYEEGARSKDWVKHKLVKTADVVVTEVTRTFKPNGVVEKGSAELAVPIRQIDDPEPWVDVRNPKKRAATISSRYLGSIDQWELEGPANYKLDARTMLPIGSASLIGKDLTIEAGSVVEVDYLYWTGVAMIQPRIVRKRDDKPAADCNLAQFPEYTRTVVTL